MVSYRFVRFVLGFGSLVAFAGLGWTLFDYLQNKDLLEARFDYVALERTFRAPDRSSLEGHLKESGRYRILHEMNITGKVEVVDDGLAAELPPPPPVGPEDVEVRYIQFVQNSPSATCAYLVDASNRVPSDLVPGDFRFIGDVFELESKPGVSLKVEAIRKEEVDLRVLTEEEPFTVRTGEDDVDTSGLVTLGGADEFRPVPPQNTRMSEPGIYEIGVDDMKGMSGMEEDQILAEVRMRKDRDPITQEVRGLRIQGLSEDSIFSRQGLLEDDVILSVNGFAASDRSALLRHLRAMKNPSSLEVEVLRFGSRRTLTYRLPRR